MLPSQSLPDPNVKRMALRAICRHFGEEIGYAELTMETTIRQFLGHVRLGARVFNVYDQFSDINALEPEFGKFVLVAEAQDVCFWGVDLDALDRIDAAVYRGGYLVDADDEAGYERLEDMPEVPFTWEEFGGSFFQFFASSLFWNAVNDGWEFSGMAKLKRGEISRLQAATTAVDIGSNKCGLDFLSHGTDAIIAVDVSREVFAAARTSADWEMLLGVVPRLHIWDD